MTQALKGDSQTVQATVGGDNLEFKFTLTRRLRDILLEGGLLNYTKAGHQSQLGGKR
jgi:hypothetical protein